MIKDYQVQTRGDKILLGLAIDYALLDVVTDRLLLANCKKLIETPHNGLVFTQLGTFGHHPVMLNIHANDEIALFVDGPEFNEGRTQSVAIWVDATSLLKIINELINNS
ncbi:MAG: hypothetical protein HZA50_00720 [Planctomycetes bacterium]|nr:hypothetical protein [Planctomycetota bacterium]